MKKSYFKIIWKSLESSLSIIGLILSVVLAIIPILPILNEYKIIISCLFPFIVFLVYVVIIIYKYINFKQTKSITIKFHDSKVNIYYGDIFSKENDGYKVIAFNEYFDTITDDELHVIDKESLHGIYLNKFYKTEESRKDFHYRIESSLEKYRSFENVNRCLGYTQAYKLGTLFEDKDFLLMAFTKFDKDNKAHVKYSEMVTSFIRMWFNIDKVKGTKKVYLPLIGSGITRFDDGEVSNTDILISLIDTFKISRVKFKHPANVNIILYGKELGIDLVSIKERYNSRIKG